MHQKILIIKEEILMSLMSSLIVLMRKVKIMLNNKILITILIIMKQKNRKIKAQIQIAKIITNLNRINLSLKPL